MERMVVRSSVLGGFPQNSHPFMTYTNAMAPILTVYGPGNLHHIAYASNQGIENLVANLPITAGIDNRTDIILGFSYSYNGFAFYWDGAGTAFWRIAASSPFTEPVGTSWANATSIPWGTEVVLGADVRAEVSAAGNLATGIIAAYIIPGNLD
ncbi:hypothetical protein MVEN_02595400 [Mycena venus]|uniref:Uncharacterized protein n=1 Tax=Mycena venus TaxID=2733690 RepID=A0A8H6U196_9AGAR|nr:hypothetical protein MVEN_02595400 [Mycena venus]